MKGGVKVESRKKKTLKGSFLIHCSRVICKIYFYPRDVNFIYRKVLKKKFDPHHCT